LFIFRIWWRSIYEVVTLVVSSVTSDAGDWYYSRNWTNSIEISLEALLIVLRTKQDQNLACSMHFRPNHCSLCFGQKDTPTSNIPRLLRFDPYFGLAIGKLESQHARCAAGRQKHSESRLEWLSALVGAETLCKVTADIEGTGAGISRPVLCFMTAHHVSSLLKLDVTDDPVHGQLAWRFQPLLRCLLCAFGRIFCGGHLLSAKCALQMSMTRQREPSTNSDVSFHTDPALFRCNLLCGDTIPVTTL